MEQTDMVINVSLHSFSLQFTDNTTYTPVRKTDHSETKLNNSPIQIKIEKKAA